MMLLLILFTLCICFGVSELPVNFSWADQNNTNYVPSARNQHFPEVCNSGWAISATDVLSSRIKINRKAVAPDIQISPQVLLQCDALNFGCYGGDARNAFRWIKDNNITDQTCNSYKANNRKECTSLSKCSLCSLEGCKGQSNSKIYSIKQFGNIAGENDMMNEIYANGPISCGIALTNEFKNISKTIFQDYSKNQKIQHYVTVYGWGEENGIKFWKVLNSWGTFWGDNGSFRIVRGQNNLGIESQCAFAIPQDSWTDDIRNVTPTTQFQLNQKHSYLDNLTFLTPHRSSEGCSSWAVAVTTTLNDKISRDSHGRMNVYLSPQVLINCKVGTCQDGNPYDAIQFIHKFGVTQQSCQNYFTGNPGKNSCTDFQNCATCSGYIGTSICNAVKSPKRWRIPDFGTLNGAQNIKKQIDQWGPVVCGMQSSTSFINYKGGILKQVSILPKINHYVQLVGHGLQKGQQYWIGRNFMGSAWGQNGFFRITMHGNNLGIQTNCYFIGTAR